ncbi:GDSL-type esterase/lipase family protein [Yinghuangia aomiensis]
MRVTADGTSARIRLSNLYGASALTVAGATVAKTGDGAATVPGTTRDLTFQQGRQLMIPAGAKAASDPLPFPVRAMEEVTVTLYLAGTTGPATFHAQAFNSSYRATGDHRGDSTGDAFTQSSASWVLPQAESMSPAIRGATGPSLPSATRSPTASAPPSTPIAVTPTPSPNASAGAGTPRPVLNAGIGGNTVLNDSSWYGDKGIQRFARDVLGTPGVDTVLLLQGVNDIGFSETDQPTYKPAPVVSARDLIAGYRNMIRKAHEHGVRIVGATLLPFGGSDHYGPHAAAVSNEVNDWIRSSREFDAVVDFDPGSRRPGRPGKAQRRVRQRRSPAPQRRGLPRHGRQHRPRRPVIAEPQP